MIANTSYGASPVKRKRRTRSEIESLESALYDLAKELRPCCVRQIFYQAVVRGLIEKSENSCKTIGRILVNMRRGGRLPYSWLSDHTRWCHKPDSHNNLQQMLELSKETYRRAMWNDQPRHVEIWIEKSSLVGVVFPVTSEWDVPLMPTRGYPSLTFLYEAADDIKSIGKPTSIYYFGDHDPSGCHISQKIEQELRAFAPEVDLSFERVAVNEDQIVEWDLPTRPTKKSDSRSKGFKGESVELDALSPQRLRSLVRTCIEQHIDKEILARTQRVESLEKCTLQRIVHRLDRSKASE